MWAASSGGTHGLPTGTSGGTGVENSTNEGRTIVTTRGEHVERIFLQAVPQLLTELEASAVKFRIRLREDPTHEIPDGLTVFADVKEVDGETLVRKRRMVFVADTAPIRNVRKLKQGQCMLVLGMPRLNLSLVSFRAREGVDDPDVLAWNMPYEMVIVGDFRDNRCES